MNTISRIYIKNINYQESIIIVFFHLDVSRSTENTEEQEENDVSVCRATGKYI